MLKPGPQWESRRLRSPRPGPCESADWLAELQCKQVMEKLSSLLARNKHGLSQDWDRRPRTPWRTHPPETWNATHTRAAESVQHLPPRSQASRPQEGRWLGHTRLLTTVPHQTQQRGDNTETSQKPATEGRRTWPPPDAARPVRGCEARARGRGVVVRGAHQAAAAHPALSA